MKRALITGITGQDGSYLAELLLQKGYEVFGLVRRSSLCNFDRIKNILNKIKIIEGEISDYLSVAPIIEQYQFDEVYNLAAMSHVGTSFHQPMYTIDVDAKGPLNLLESILKFSKHTKLYQASTSEMFGKAYSKSTDWEGYEYKYQDENTPFMPQSPYACAKCMAHQLVRIYRESYGLYACSGILFNHESPRRGEQFVTRKITKWIGEFERWRNHKFYPTSVPPFDPSYGNPEDAICFGTCENGKNYFPKLRLGNLDAYRDWGHAKDYVYGMWLMLQQDAPDDFVLATGKSYTVRKFLEKAFALIGISDFTPYVVIDPAFYRAAEVDFLLGNAQKAKDKLKWVPFIQFDDLVEDMVYSDINGVF